LREEGERRLQLRDRTAELPREPPDLLPGDPLLLLEVRGAVPDLDRIDPDWLLFGTSG
jgi:hypothetical protein